MRRAAKLCSHHDCPNPKPCPDHKPKPWQGKKVKRLDGRRAVARRRRILTKYRTVCHVCGNPGGTEVDHVVPLAEGGADEAENMRPIHTDCHAVKSKEERERGLRRSRVG